MPYDENADHGLGAVFFIAVFLFFLLALSVFSLYAVRELRGHEAHTQTYEVAGE